MPSLKKSQSSSKRLTAKVDDQILKDAIEFLFQIKAIQYAVKHPDFIAPSAEEFFFYVTRLEEPSSIKRSCLSNRFNSFLCFLTPMFHDNHTCSSIISALTITIYALCLYTVTGSYLKDTLPTLPLNRALQTIEPTTIADAVNEPLTHFITSYMTYVPKQGIKTIVDLSREFVRQTVIKLPTQVHNKMPALNATEIGKDICDGIDKIYNCHLFFIKWKAPTAVLLTRCGLTPCRSICDEIKEFIETKPSAAEFLGF